MIFLKSITYFMMAAAVLMMCGCSDHDDAESGGDALGDGYVELTLEVSTGQTIHTRAQTGPVAGTGNENKIYDIQVWAYDHSGGADATPIGYAEIKNIGGGSGAETTSSSTAYADATVKMTLFLPKSFVENESSKIDLYFLANYRSIMAEAPSNSITRNALEALNFGGDYFGIDATTRAPKATAVEDGKGLPMSAVRKNLSLSEMLQVNGPLHLRYNETVMLKRAVSRIAFFFSRQIGINPNVTIKKVEIDGNLIPASEMVFPNQTNNDLPNLPNGVTYDAGVCRLANTTNDANPILVKADIPETTNPELLRSDCETNGNATMTAQEYVNFIEGKASQTTPEATKVGYYYLRETGEKITGTIFYTYGGTDKTATFTMNSNNDFARNHTWIVYAYFLKEGLYVIPMVQPWIVGGIHSIYSKTSVQLYVDPTYNSIQNGTGIYRYKIYNENPPDGWSPGNWKVDRDNTYCPIAYGFEEGRPLYGPWMRLTTTTINNLHLQVNNTNYGFVTYDPHFHNTPEAYSSILDEITIPAGTNVETHFYVVPKYEFNISNPPSRYVNVSLVERTNAGEGGNLEDLVGRIPWNSILPGPEGRMIASFYYVTPTEYNNNRTENGVTLYECEIENI